MPERPDQSHAEPTTFRQFIASNRSFRFVWSAEAVSFIGDWFHTIALYLLVKDMTGSATAVGGIMVAKLLPGLISFPIAGVLADRYSRKILMILADVARSVIVLMFLIAIRIESLSMLYTLMVVHVLFGALFDTCSQAIVPQLVGREQIVRAYTITGVTWSTMLAVGSALGGITIALVGIPMAFLVDSCSYILSALILSRLAMPTGADRQARRPQEPTRSFRRDLREGLNYLRREPLVFGIVFCKSGLGFGTAMSVLLPFFAFEFARTTASGDSILLTEPFILGVLYGVRGVGTALGPILARAVFGEKDRTLAVLIVPAFLVMAIFQFVFPLAPSVLPAALALVLAAMGSSAVWVFSTSLLQIHTDNRYRGRVTSIEWMSFTFSMACCCFLVGVVKDRFVFLTLTQIAQFVAISSLIPATAWTVFLFLVRRRLRATGRVGSYAPPEFAVPQPAVDKIAGESAPFDLDTGE